MPAWLTIAVTDLDTYLVAAQVTALRTAALRAGQADPFTEIMPTVVQRIRAEVQGCANNQVSATPNTVPPELHDAACLLIIERMQARIPGLDLTQGQKDLIEQAYEYLKRVSQCGVPISQPDDPLGTPEVQSGGFIKVVSSSTRQATRSKLAGL